MLQDANGQPLSRISERKLQHLRLSLEASVQSTKTAGFERFTFEHKALPELDFDEIKTDSKFLGKSLQLPFVVSSMTGGALASADINRRLALTAQSLGIAFGVGSQRAGLSHKDLRFTYQVRSVAPDILLFANLGAVQLNYGVRREQCVEAVEMIGADGLILHLNPLQEVLQPEGDRNFKGLLEKIAELTAELAVPVVVKEVGCGISAEVACQLVRAGVAAIDVAGLGGTSFARVEAFRRERPEEVELGLAFSDWGIPTSEALRQVRSALPETPLIASGGIRHGLDAAKAVALGADLSGFAHAVLAAATEGEEPVRRLLQGFAWQLKVAMFCSGARTLSDLRRVRLLEAAA